MTEGRSFRFTHFLSRQPAMSVAGGLRAGDGADPDAFVFAEQHAAYVSALESAGGLVTVLPALEDFPDSVFIEDPAICSGSTAIVLRPGARSRFGEAAALLPALVEFFEDVIDLPGEGSVDGGDVLLSDNEAFIGLSARTDQEGFNALAGVLGDLGYLARKVETPSSILHFKTDCGLLDSETIFASTALASTNCFSGYRVIEAPEGEEAAANLVRVNDVVLLSTGYPKSEELLNSHGYRVQTLDTSEAAKVDGGLSCMSLRFSVS